MKPHLSSEAPGQAAAPADAARATGHRYDYHVNLGNANAAAANVVEYVGTGKRVLEIGSGPGSITRQLREVGACTIVAIEIDEEAARRVAPYCERVHQADLNRAGWSQQVCADGLFDVVVAADVLEHLVDPWAALREMVCALREGGHIVLSLPHAAHNAVIASFLNGDIAYADAGLLDRTHIRFFGIHNMQALLDGAGLAIIDAHFVARPPGLTELAQQWSRLTPALRMALTQNRFGGIYQVVVKAGRAANAPPGLRLADLAAPRPEGTLLQRLAASIWTGLSARLSPAARDRVRNWVKRLGLRV